MVDSATTNAVCANTVAEWPKSADRSAAPGTRSQCRARGERGGGRTVAGKNKLGNQTSAGVMYKSRTDSRAISWRTALRGVLTGVLEHGRVSH